MTHEPAPPGPRPATAFALIGAVLAVLTATAFLARPLTPIDETRYIGVAWEMWLRGDFLVPFKNGMPYSDKPPLLMWLYQLGWAVFGVNEWWPRLVSPLCSALSLAMTYRLARRLWPQQPEAGSRALLVLGSSLLWLLFSTAAMFDVLLASWVLLGIVAIEHASRTAGMRGFALLALALGLGILTKGPVVLLHVLPVAVLAPWWRPGIARRRWYAGLALAVLAGALLALAWAIPAGRQGGAAYQHAIFWGQTANRMVQSFAHQRPFWWYLPLLPVILFPWSLWPATWRGLFALRARALDPGTRFCLAWCVPVFLALCLISGKQPHYLVPLLPAFALLGARALPRETPGLSWLPWLGAALGLVLALLACGWLNPPGAPLAARPALWPALALSGFSMLLAWLGRARNRRPTLLLLTLFGAGLTGLAQCALAPLLRSGYDVTPLATAIAGLQRQGVAIANDGVYHDQFHFAGRLEQPLTVLDDEPALVAWLAARPEAYAVLYLDRRAALPASGIAAQQPYRGERAVLASSAAALALLRPNTVPAPRAPCRDSRCQDPIDAALTTDAGDAGSRASPQQQ